MFRALGRFLYTLEAPRIDGAPVQAGALCWRRTGKGLEFLLVTGRHSGRWSLPAGWGLRGRPLYRTASREAWEEAGVRGTVQNILLGLARKSKRYRLIGSIEWQLAVYPLEVSELRDDFPEVGQRERRWFSAEEAARRVRPVSLRPVIEAFRPPCA